MATDLAHPVHLHMPSNHRHLLSHGCCALSVSLHPIFTASLSFKYTVLRVMRDLCAAAFLLLANWNVSVRNSKGSDLLFFRSLALSCLSTRHF